MTEPFALDEGVVVAAAGARLGDLVDVEAVQPGGDVVVDELQPVVGVESADGEGERPEQGVEVALVDGIDPQVAGGPKGWGRRRSPMAMCTGRVGAGSVPRRH